ncbi:unnamed protein product [Nippostrongylus brasiliensis]|uniref:Response regulatory domain-containing protein n=1 Tax=Nippostrongylus brasiliensis TaxID=27835 RepID=A0A0N4YG25_NIPBR|nr:unnamed protein product [Nippostrongylus brasiliensis]
MPTSSIAMVPPKSFRLVLIDVEPETTLKLWSTTVSVIWRTNSTSYPSPRRWCGCGRSPCPTPLHKRLPSSNRETSAVWRRSGLLTPFEKIRSTTWEELRRVRIEVVRMPVCCKNICDKELTPDVWHIG